MPQTTEAGQAGPELLRLDEIGIRLGGRIILSDVSFAVRPGEFTGLIGPNGAGKTTLLKVILGLLAPTSGRVLLDGRTPPPRGRGRIIGYVPQKLAIAPALRVDNPARLVFCPHRRRRVPRPARAAVAQW